MKKSTLAFLFWIGFVMAALAQDEIQLAKYTLDMHGAYVYLKNTSDHTIRSVDFRLIYSDRKGVELDYADFSFPVDIETGMTRRYPVKIYGRPGEFECSDHQQNIKVRFILRSVTGDTKTVPTNIKQDEPGTPANLIVPRRNYQ